MCWMNEEILRTTLPLYRGKTVYIYKKNEQDEFVAFKRIDELQFSSIPLTSPINILIKDEISTEKFNIRLKNLRSVIDNHIDLQIVFSNGDTYKLVPKVA